MQKSLVVCLIAATLLSAPALVAQTNADPSGHWDGAISGPGGDLPFAIDLVKNAKGGLEGAVSIPAQNIQGLPLTGSVNGKLIQFQARDDQPFYGQLSDDGKSLSGNLSASGEQVPMTMTRHGDAKLVAPEKSPAIGKELEGTWNGLVDTPLGQLHVIMTLTNQLDGTSTGSIVNVDEGGLRIPVVIVQSGSKVTIALKAVGSSFTGTLNPEATELAGTYTEGSHSIPLSFERAAPQAKK